MKNNLLIIFLLVFVSTTAFSEIKKIDFTEFTLDNGMHVILHKDNTVPIVSLSMTYKVGSKDEKPDRTGFAHYIEHLMFEGSRHIDRGEVFKLIQDAGGTINATTNQDRTLYFMTLPSNQLELGLWIESERLNYLDIDSTGVEIQRQVIKEERYEKLDNQPYGTIIEETFARAFTKHPYNWLPIGSEQYIDKATIEEFREFHKTYYVPNNVVLSIAGDIDIEKTKESVKKHFNDIPKGTKEIVRTDIEEPPLNGEIRDTIYDRIHLPAVIHGYRVPERGTKDAYAIDMLNTLLADGQGSRMYRKIVIEQELAAGLQAFPILLEDHGLFMIFSAANMGTTIKDVEAAINKEIEKVQSEIISDNEYKKILNQTESKFIQQFASLENIANKLAEYHLFFNDPNIINTKIDIYKSITKEDLMRVANEYLVPENRVVLYYLPE